MKKSNIIVLVFILGCYATGNVVSNCQCNVQLNQDLFVQKNSEQWTMVNHDLHGTRFSPQTIIGRNNVGRLELQWIYNNTNEEPIENSPLIVNGIGFSQDNMMRIRAFYLCNGTTIWTYAPVVPHGAEAHGMTFHEGIIYAPTGARGTIVALNATTGNLIWETGLLSAAPGFSVGFAPIIWKDYVLVGAAGGDEPPVSPAVKGAFRAINRTTGRQIWETPLAVGAWVSGELANINGGAASWSSGSVDEETGIVYIPVGNASPDFNATTRPGIQLYANHVVAINIYTGAIVWATPFLAEGTVLTSIVNASIPDVHDYDVAWGTILVEVDFCYGKQKVVIGHDKLANIIAMRADNGQPIWWANVGTVSRAYVPPMINGSGPIWVGTQNGIEAFAAADKDTLYVAVSNGAYNFFVNGTSGRVEPAFEEPGMENGIGNGSIVALSLKTGRIRWQYNTPAPTWVSPVVSNGVVYTGHVTAPGVGYTSDIFGAPRTNTPNTVTGVLLALDAETGELLWSYDVAVPIGIGGPSIGNGMLLVPTGSEDEIGSNTVGHIYAFALP